MVSGMGLLAFGLAWIGRRRKGGTTNAPVIVEADCSASEEEAMADRPYCGPDGGSFVDEAALAVIDDQKLRQRWSDFDLRFLRHCIEGGDQGLVFSPKGFAELQETDPQLLQLGVKIYNRASRAAAHQRHTCYRVLNILAMAYFSATRAVR